MKYVRLYQRHGWNPAGSEIALSDTQAEWMVDRGHGEIVESGKAKTPAPEPTPSSARPVADPVKIEDTSPEPQPDLAPPKRKPGRPRKNA